MQEVKIDFGCIKLLSESGNTIEKLKKEIRMAEFLNKIQDETKN